MDLYTHVRDLNRGWQAWDRWRRERLAWEDNPTGPEPPATFELRGRTYTLDEGPRQYPKPFKVHWGTSSTNILGTKSFATREEAESHLRALKADYHRSGRVVTGRRATFGEFFAEYCELAPISKATLKTRIIQIERWVLPVWRQRLMHTITHSDVLRVIQNAREGRVPENTYRMPAIAGLSSAEMVEIRDARTSWTHAKLAQKFGTTQQVIRRVLAMPDDKYPRSYRGKVSLTPKECDEVRRLYRQPKPTLEELANKYKVNVATIQRIVRTTRRDEAAPLSESSCHNLLSHISAIFEMAASNGLVINNPARQLKRHERPKQRRERKPHPFTKDKIERLLEANASVPEVYAFILCGYEAGMRQGEVTALRVRDILFDQNQIRVTQARDVDGDEKDTKTEAGERLIPLLPRLREALERLIKLYDLEPDDRLFATTHRYRDANGLWINGEPGKGRPWSKKVCATRMREACERAGLPYGDTDEGYTFKDLRNTFIWHAMSGELTGKPVDVGDVQEWVGHASHALTLGVYRQVQRGVTLERVLGERTVSTSDDSMTSEQQVELNRLQERLADIEDRWLLGDLDEERYRRLSEELKRRMNEIR